MENNKLVKYKESNKILWIYSSHIHKISIIYYVFECYFCIDKSIKLIIKIFCKF